MAKVTAEFISTDNVEVTMTITMPMRDWKALRDDLPTRWPAWKIGSAISQVVRALEGRVTEPIKE